MAMNRAQFRKELQEGLNAVFGMAYTEYPDEWKAVYKVNPSEKAYEEQVQKMGFGAARVKAEGAGIAYDSGQELWVSRFTNETIALAFAITEEAEEDNLYFKQGSEYAKALARSLKYTKEVKGAAILNTGFDSAVTYGDGKPLFSTTHPLGGGGTFSNKLATPAELSETAIEALTIQISKAVDDRGIPVVLRVKKLCVAPEQQYVATRILENPDRPGTADRDINALYKMGTVEDWAVNHYLTSGDAWFLVTDCDGGLQHFRRKNIKRGIEGDFETGNMRYKARERYVFGIHDARGVWGSEGA